MLEDLLLKGMPKIEQPMWEIRMIEPTWNLANECLPKHPGIYFVTIGVDEDDSGWYVDEKYYSTVKQAWLNIEQNYVKAWMKRPIPYKPFKKENE